MRGWALGLLLASLAARAEPATDLAGTFDATTDSVGLHMDGRFITPANQILSPAGYQFEIPAIRPHALALSPNRRLLVVAGQTHELLVLATATGKLLQHVPLPLGQASDGTPLAAGILDPDPRAQLGFAGLAFSPDGSRLYLSNVNGDVKVFAVNGDHQVSPLASFALPSANAPGRKAEIPAGIAVSPDGRKVYVALNLSNGLAELDAATGKILRTWKVGVAPLDVVLAGKKAYVSNWGGRRPQAGDAVGPAGLGTLVRVDSRSIAREGSVSVIDLVGTNGTEIVTGQHACALAPTPDGKYVAVANAGSDTVSVIATSTDQIVETICARQNPGDPFGAQPNALAFGSSGNRLYVCNGTQNAVAVFQFKPGASTLLGLIPAGWFPAAIACNSRNDRLYVANLKDLGPANTKLAGARDFCTISMIAIPSAKQLAKLTQAALANLRYPLLAQANLPVRNDQPPRPVPERVGEPCVFQHVVYIIKENRTYDQVLGDVRTGNGDAAICNFGRRVTPNEHKLVGDFVLLDNTYCSGLCSADGHQWTDTAMASDYIERAFGAWPRSYPCGGFGPANRDALAFSSAGFIWNDALRHGKTFRDYGEYASPTTHWTGPLPKDGVNWLGIYHDFLDQTGHAVVGCDPDVESLRPYLDTNTVGWDLNVPDVVRAAEFSRELKQFAHAGNFPNLVMIWLPNDHTSGTAYGAPTPAAQVADNDLALGRIVEAISHSSCWTNTCVFAVEDDASSGWDHVSGYRTTAYVASPFTRRHVTVSTQYNQTSLLRTMELMLGLPPLNQMDATATPMFDCFTNTPDFTAYSAVTNFVPLDEMNPPPAKIADAQLRKDARESARLPLAKADQCPEDLINHILWRATMGTQNPYPDWAVKLPPDD
ncbi:MAG: beta-propeller fold lactonase family protein [Verrucomicrobiota bacterium]|jgi:YVTN family beta-propeller protein